MEKPKKKRARKPKRHIMWGRFIAFIVIVLVVLAGIGWGLAAVYRHFVPAQNTGAAAIQNRQTDEFKQFSPDIPLYVLVAGVDDNNPQQANFVALAAVNIEKKHIDFIMLPGNTKIEGRKEKGNQLLADIYREGGLRLTKAVVEDIFHLPIPFYAVFSQDVFKQLVADNGGMAMYIEKDMYHANDAGVTDINLFQGYQKIDGAEALGYMRYIDQDGELSRAQRDERFVKLFYMSMQQHFGVVNMYHMHRLWNTVDSNIDPKDAASLCYTFKDVPVTDINFYILPGENTTIKGVDFWTYDPVEVQKIIGNSSNAIVKDSDDVKSGDGQKTEDKTGNKSGDVKSSVVKSR